MEQARAVGTKFGELETALAHLNELSPPNNAKALILPVSSWIPGFTGDRAAFTGDLSNALHTVYAQITQQLTTEASPFPKDSKLSAVLRSGRTQLKPLLAKLGSSEQIARQLEHAQTEVENRKASVQRCRDQLNKQVQDVDQLAQSIQALNSKSNECKGALDDWILVGGPDGIFSKRHIIPFVFETTVQRRTS